MVTVGGSAGGAAGRPCGIFLAFLRALPDEPLDLPGERAAGARAGGDGCTGRAAGDEPVGAVRGGGGPKPAHASAPASPFLAAFLGASNGTPSQSLSSLESTGTRLLGFQGPSVVSDATAPSGGCLCRAPPLDPAAGALAVLDGLFTSSVILFRFALPSSGCMFSSLDDDLGLNCNAVCRIHFSGGPAVCGGARQRSAPRDVPGR
eukprot:scaffold32199_cov108-Isochrysis_galbana.AAC.3